MNQNPLREITQELAGHIRQPMGAHEIAKELADGEYSAELIMQHLLRFVDLMADRLQDPHAVRAMVQRCEIAPIKMKYCHCPNQNGKRIASDCEDCGGVVMATGWLSKPTRGGARKGAGRPPRATPRKPLTVRLEPDHHARLKAICKARKLSQSAWVTERIIKTRP